MNRASVGKGRKPMGSVDEELSKLNDRADKILESNAKKIVLATTAENPKVWIILKDYLVSKRLSTGVSPPPSVC